MDTVLFFQLPLSNLFDYFLRLIFILCIRVLYLYVCICTICMCGACRDQKWESGILGAALRCWDQIQVLCKSKTVLSTDEPSFHAHLCDSRVLCVSDCPCVLLTSSSFHTPLSTHFHQTSVLTSSGKSAHTLGPTIAVSGFVLGLLYAYETQTSIFEAVELQIVASLLLATQPEITQVALHSLSRDLGSQPQSFHSLSKMNTFSLHFAIN